jgi:glutamine amidotransferase
MIAIVDYGLGNLYSVKKAFEALGAPATITSDPADVRHAERVVLPGIGAFADGMRLLKERGLDKALQESVIIEKKPFLGICLGLQLLADSGEEYGHNKGLGWIGGTVRALDATSGHLKVPHIGWNNVTVLRETPLFKGVKSNADFYFVHSFQLECTDASDVLATTEYGQTITAAVVRNNIFATQFHPEKSQDHGLQLLRNFIAWQP